MLNFVGTQDNSFEQTAHTAHSCAHQECRSVLVIHAEGTTSAPAHDRQRLHCTAAGPRPEAALGGSMRRARYKNGLRTAQGRDHGIARCRVRVPFACIIHAVPANRFTCTTLTLKTYDEEEA